MNFKFLDIIKQSTSEQRVFIDTSLFIVISFLFIVEQQVQKRFVKQFSKCSRQPNEQFWKDVQKLKEHGTVLNGNKCHWSADNCSNRKKHLINSASLGRKSEGVCGAKDMKLLRSAFSRIDRKELIFHPHKIRIKHQRLDEDLQPTLVHAQVAYCRPLHNIAD